MAKDKNKPGQNSAVQHEKLIDSSKVHFREYQQRIAEKVLEKGNSLVVLPTGLGKTIIALIVIEHYLREGKRVLFMAPTRPLAEQHHETMRSLLRIPPESIVLLTGSTPAEKRKEMWRNASIVAATPQTIEKDARAGRLDVGAFSLVVVDECHRSVKKYSYTYIADECRRLGVRMLGLTASPGGKRERIEAITKALGITHIEIRTERDADVAPYVKEMKTSWIEVELPREMREAKEELEAVISEHLAALKKMGLINTTNPRVPKRVLIEIGRRIQKRPDHITKFIALSRHATVMNLCLAHEYLETQGVYTFLRFFEKMEQMEKKSKAVKRILADKRIQAVLARMRALDWEHPKLAKLVEVIKERRGKTVIIFVQYRDQVKRIVEELVRHGIQARQFVGKREGITQKEQRETIEAFRRGEFEVLVASSIGEEGLDIPAVDSVIFYEPIPSEIRAIQRRGRAGRAKAGEVVVLITKGTRDEAYYWIEKKREQAMRSIVKGMQGELGEAAQGREQAHESETPPKRGQLKMTDYF